MPNVGRSVSAGTLAKANNPTAHTSYVQHVSAMAEALLNTSQQGAAPSSAPTPARGPAWIPATNRAPQSSAAAAAYVQQAHTSMLEAPAAHSQRTTAHQMLESSYSVNRRARVQQVIRAADPLPPHMARYIGRRPGHSKTTRIGSAPVDRSHGAQQQTPQPQPQQPPQSQPPHARRTATAPRAPHAPSRGGRAQPPSTRVDHDSAVGMLAAAMAARARLRAAKNALAIDRYGGAGISPALRSALNLESNEVEASVNGGLGSSSTGACHGASGPGGGVSTSAAARMRGCSTMPACAGDYRSFTPAPVQPSPPRPATVPSRSLPPPSAVSPRAGAPSVALSGAAPAPSLVPASAPSSALSAPGHTAGHRHSHAAGSPSSPRSRLHAACAAGSQADAASAPPPAALPSSAPSAVAPPAAHAEEPTRRTSATAVSTLAGAPNSAKPSPSRRQAPAPASLLAGGGAGGGAGGSDGGGSGRCEGAGRCANGGSGGSGGGGGGGSAACLPVGGGTGTNACCPAPSPLVRGASSSDPLSAYGYVTQSPIAAGAFSQVVRARHLASGREVAVKTMLTRMKGGRQPGDLDIIAKEVEALTALQPSAHANIANLVEKHETDYELHVILEYCGGGSVQRHLQGQGHGVGLEESLAATIAAQVPRRARGREMGNPHDPPSPPPLPLLVARSLERASSAPRVRLACAFDACPI